MADACGDEGSSRGSDGSRLTLERVSGEEYDMLRDVIVDSGALLYRLAPARHSLADVFASDSGEAGETGESEEPP